MESVGIPFVLSVKRLLSVRDLIRRNGEVISPIDYGWLLS